MLVCFLVSNYEISQLVFCTNIRSLLLKSKLHISSLLKTPPNHTLPVQEILSSQVSIRAHIWSTFTFLFRLLIPLPYLLFIPSPNQYNFLSLFKHSNTTGSLYSCVLYLEIQSTVNQDYVDSLSFLNMFRFLTIGPYK